MKRSKAWLLLLLIPLCLLIWSCSDDNDTTEVSNNYYYEEESDSTPDYDSTQPAIVQSYATVREPARGLEDSHTVYRPADLSKFEEGSIPVIVWANGACRPSNYGFVFISTMVASHGFIVIANGAYDYPAISGGSVDETKQIAAMDWLESDEGIHQLKGRANVDKIAVAGQSCGGNEALLAGADERAKTVLAWNTGFFADGESSLSGTRADLANLHSPVIFINGGEDDVAYDNSNANYEIVAGNSEDYPMDGLPVYYAEHTHAGHSGLLYGIYDGSGDTTLLTEAERLYVNWLDFVLNGNDQAEAYFFDTGVSQIDEWENWFPLWEPDVDDDDGEAVWNVRSQNWD